MLLDGQVLVAGGRTLDGDIYGSVATSEAYSPHTAPGVLLGIYRFLEPITRQLCSTTAECGLWRSFRCELQSPTTVDRRDLYTLTETEGTSLLMGLNSINGTAHNVALASQGDLVA